MVYNQRRLEADLKQYGLLRIAEDIALRGLNRVMLLKILCCLKLDTVRPEFISPPTGYRGTILTDSQLSQFSKLPEYDLPQTFVDQASAKGDQCYALFRGETLGAYQWYSTEATDYGRHGMKVKFSNDYVYMYKAFTHPAHRGKRLYPIGVTAMLAAYSSRRYRGMVCLVDINNFASLSSCYRMGFTDCGRIYAAALFNRCFSISDLSARDYGFRLTVPDENSPQSLYRTT